MNKSKNILIVGMPRSGTSMTTNIFAKQGYFIAENPKKQLRAGDEYNPSGYWEAQPLIDSNVEILETVGFNYDNTWLFEEIKKETAQAIKSTPPLQRHINLIDEYNSKKPWVWKDPRLCYTLSYWWPLLDSKTTAVLFLIRKPDEIYQSFLRLKWISFSMKDKIKTYQLIKNHIENARETINNLNIPHIEIDYSDYEKKPQETVNLFNDFFNLNLRIDDLYYDKKLNHKGISGRFKIILEKFISVIPNNFKQHLKKLIPSSILNKIFPHRYP